MLAKSGHPTAPCNATKHANSLRRVALLTFYERLSAAGHKAAEGCVGDGVRGTATLGHRTTRSYPGPADIHGDKRRSTGDKVGRAIPSPMTTTPPKSAKCITAQPSPRSHRPAPPRRTVEGQQAARHRPPPLVPGGRRPPPSPPRSARMRPGQIRVGRPRLG